MKYLGDMYALEVTCILSSLIIKFFHCKKKKKGPRFFLSFHVTIICVWLYLEVYDMMALSLAVMFMFQAGRRSRVEQKGMCSPWIFLNQENNRFYRNSFQ